MARLGLCTVSHCCRQDLLCKMLLWTLLAQDPGGRRLGSAGARAGNRKWILCSVSVTLVPVMVFPFLTQVSLSKPLFFMQVL